MKKSLRFLAAAIAIVAAAASCTKENPAPEDNGIQFSEGVTFTASFPETKAGFDNTTGKMTWEAGDQILVSDGVNEEVVTLKDTDITNNGRYATFIVPGLDSEASYAAAFPAKDAYIWEYEIGYIIPVGFEEQTDAFKSFAFSSKCNEGAVDLFFKPACPIVCISTAAENVEYFVLELLGSETYRYSYMITSSAGKYVLGGEAIDTEAAGLAAVAVDGKAYIPLAPGSVATGYKVRAYCTDNSGKQYLAGVYVKEFDSPVEFKQGYFYNIAADVMDELVVDGFMNLQEKITPTKTNFKVLLNNAVVTYVNGNNAFIEDSGENAAGFQIYKSGHGLKVGDALDGLFDVEAYLYNNIPEITDFTADEDNPGTITPGATVPETVETIESLCNAIKFYRRVNQRVLLKGITFDEALDKEVDITDGTNTIHVYSKTSVAKVAAGSVVNMYCYPSFYTKDSVTYSELLLWEAPEVIGGPGVITASTTTKTVEVDGSATIDVTINSGATISAVSANNDVATASINNTTGVLTINGIAAGTTTVTLSAPAKDYFTAPENVVINVTVKAVAAGDTSVTYDFTDINFTEAGWSTKYEEHVVNYGEATVTFENADKQNAGGTIDNMPVTKGNNVYVTMTNGKVIKSVTFVCKQWTTKAQTITMYGSNDAGETYSDKLAESSEFKIEKDLDDYYSTLKFEFSSSSNQIGIESLTITYGNAE